MSYTLFNGDFTQHVRSLRDAYKQARWWSSECGKVVSIIEGGRTLTYIYRGREISGKLADQIWKNDMYAVM